MDEVRNEDSNRFSVCLRLGRFSPQEECLDEKVHCGHSEIAVPNEIPLIRMESLNIFIRFDHKTRRKLCAPDRSSPKEGDGLLETLQRQANNDHLHDVVPGHQSDDIIQSPSAIDLQPVALMCEMTEAVLLRSLFGVLVQHLPASVQSSLDFRCLRDISPSSVDQDHGRVEMVTSEQAFQLTCTGTEDSSPFYSHNLPLSF